MVEYLVKMDQFPTTIMGYKEVRELLLLRGYSSKISPHYLASLTAITYKGIEIRHKAKDEPINDICNNI